MHQPVSEPGENLGNRMEAYSVHQKSLKNYFFLVFSLVDYTFSNVDDFAKRN